MNIAAISPVPRVAAPYPARIPLLDDTRPVWETEFTARQAQRAAQLRAGRNAQPVANARIAQVPAGDGRADAATATPPRAPALAATPAQPTVDVDLLRDQHADFRMRRAIDDFIAAPVQPSANGTQDLGTIAGLTPLQPYRVAMGNPQVQELQTAVALKAAGLGIPKVANIGPVENATDNARYRPGART